MQEVWTMLLAVLLFALACNLDTVLLAMGYAAKGIRVSFAHSLLIAAVTTLVTWLSLALGDAAAQVLPTGLTGALGGVVLVGIGLWFLLDYLRNLGQGTQEQPPPAAHSAWGWVSLAAALAVNNAGIGVAAGVTGIAPLWAASGNFCRDPGRPTPGALAGPPSGRAAAGAVRPATVRCAAGGAGRVGGAGIGTAAGGIPGVQGACFVV